MSARHHCPHCRAPFSYSPDDYHRRVTCSSPRCGRPFGFHLHHMSDLALRNLREEVLRARDEAARRAAGLRRRAQRAARGGAGNEEEADLARAFAAGLADECPKCGVDFADLLREGVPAEVHLMTCNDERSRAEQRAKREARRERDRAREEARAGQDDAEARAAWDFLGRNDDQLYLLSEGQLRKEVEGRGLEVRDGEGRADMIAALVSRERSLVAREEGDRGGAPARDLPSMPTLQRMDADELRAVLASRGVGGTKGMTRRQMLDLLEDRACANNDDDDVAEVKLLTSGVKPERQTKGRRRKPEAGSDEDSFEGAGADEVSNRNQKKKAQRSKPAKNNEPAKKKLRRKKKIEMDSDEESDDEWSPDD